MRVGWRAALVVAALVIGAALPGGSEPARAGEGAFVAGEPGCRRVALIFNIGVGFEPAFDILDTLETSDTDATMFMMGWWLDWDPVSARRIAAAGHPIGSHGNWPPELTLRDDAGVKADLWGAEEAFLRVLGEPPAPYLTGFAGASDDRIDDLADRLGYLTVGWTVDTADWNPEVSAADIHQRVMAQVYDGAIVELHLDAAASTETTAVALPWIIEDLRAQGYRFVTIPEMTRPCGVGDPPEATPDGRGTPVAEPRPDAATWIGGDVPIMASRGGGPRRNTAGAG